MQALFLSVWKEELVQQFFFGSNMFEKSYFVRLIHEQSILAVCVAEFKLFREQEIRMLLFTTDGYANKLNLHFVFPFRTLPFNQFVKRASEDVHEEYFICPVSKPLLSFRATSFSSSVSV